MCIPISYIMIMLGYTYSEVFGSKSQGFFFAVPIIFTGAIIGEYMAFTMSRYLFKDFVKEQINNSEWLSHKFNVVDEIIKEEGRLFVFLIKLAFTPVGLFSYVMGVSSISFPDFALGHISYLFWSSSLCFIGCSLSSGSSTEGAQ